MNDRADFSDYRGASYADTDDAPTYYHTEEALPTRSSGGGYEDDPDLVPPEYFTRARTASKAGPAAVAASVAQEHPVETTPTTDNTPGWHVGSDGQIDFRARPGEGSVNGVRSPGAADVQVDLTNVTPQKRPQNDATPLDKPTFSSSIGTNVAGSTELRVENEHGFITRQIEQDDTGKLISPSGFIEVTTSHGRGHGQALYREAARQLVDQGVDLWEGHFISPAAAKATEHAMGKVDYYDHDPDGNEVVLPMSAANAAASIERGHNSLLEAERRGEVKDMEAGVIHGRTDLTDPAVREHLGIGTTAAIQSSDVADNRPANDPLVMGVDLPELKDKDEPRVQALIEQAAGVGVTLSPEAALKVSEAIIPDHPLSDSNEELTQTHPEHVEALKNQAAAFDLYLSDAAALEVSKVIRPEAPTAVDAAGGVKPIPTNIPHTARLEALEALDPSVPSGPVVLRDRRDLRQTTHHIGEELRERGIDFKDLLPDTAYVSKKLGHLLLDSSVPDAQIAQVADEAGHDIQVAVMRQRLIRSLQRSEHFPPDITIPEPRTRTITGIAPLGIRLNEYRKAIGVTLAALARHTTISELNLYEFFRGDTLPAPARIATMLRALGVPRTIGNRVMKEYEEMHGTDMHERMQARSAAAGLDTD